MTDQQAAQGGNAGGGNAEHKVEEREASGAASMFVPGHTHGPVVNGAVPADPGTPGGGGEGVHSDPAVQEEGSRAGGGLAPSRQGESGRAKS